MPTLRSALLLSSNADYPLINASENNIDGQFTIFVGLNADPKLTQEDSADDFSFNLEVVNAGGTATFGKDYSLVIQEGNLEKSLTSLGSSIPLNDISLSPTSSIANVGITGYMGLITLLVRPIDDSIIEIDPETIDLDLKITVKNSNNQEDSIIFSGSDIVNIEDYEFTPSISNYTPVIYETAVDFGDAVSFDGVDDYVQLTDGSVAGAFDGGSTAFTITGWIKPNSLSSKTTNHAIENVFLARAADTSNDNFELGITTDGKLNLYLDTDGGDTTIELGNGELTTGEWHSFALVFDAGSVTAYIDGNKYTGSVKGTRLDNANGSPFTLGASINVDTFYDGEIDELGIWNAALTEDEIIDIRYNTLSGDENNLVAYYNFDKDSVDGTTIADVTQNSNNGTLKNGDDANFVDSEIPTFKGHVDIELANKVTKEPGIILSYQIDSDSTATQDEDFYNSQTDISTTDGEPQTDSIFIAQGEDSARIYLTALPDAVVEGDENIKLTLLPDFNKALNLNGVDDYVEVSTIQNPTDAITVEAWAKSDSTTWNSSGSLVSKRNAFILHPQINRKDIVFYIHNGSQWYNVIYTPDNSFDITQWHHYAGTYDGVTLRFYIDGKEVSTSEVNAGAINLDNGVLNIGRDDGFSNRYFDGQIDDVRIWSKARTQAEIQDTIYTTLNGNESNLIAYYNFNDDFVEGNVISNVSANKSLSFDGSDDYVNLNNSVVGLAQNDFTLEAWIKTTGTGEAIIVKNDGDTSWERGEKAFYINNSGKVDFVGFGNNYIRGTTAVNDGQWHHVAVVWDYSSGTSGTGKIYVDGVNDTSSSGYRANNGYKSGDTLKIGRPNYGEAPNHFSGEIDEVRIWNKARSQAEIQSTRNSSLNGNESNLVAYYTFDDASATDLTSNNNNGTINGATFLNSNNDSFQNNGNLNGQLISNNKVLSLDGNGDYVSFNNNLNIGDSYTIEGWFNSNNSSNQTLVALTDGGSNNHYALIELRSNGNLRFLHRSPAGGSGGTNIYSSTAYNDGEWHHLAAVKNTSGLTLYVDGIEVGRETDSSRINDDVNLTIGQLAPSNSSRPVNGQIDEIRIWNTARTSNEIKNYRNQKLDGTEDGLVAYYSFDDGTANDNTSNGNNGSFIGNATTTTNNDVPISAANNFTDSLAFDPFAINGPTYSIETTQSAEITIKDTDAYTTGVLIVDEYGDEINNTNSAVVDENGEAKFKIKLSSEPTANVTITLNTNQGSLDITLDITSFTFNDSNWDTYREITVSGLGSSFDDFNITATLDSNDTDYSGSKNVTISDSSNNVKVKVTEGGPELDLTPTVSITATSDATEGNESEPGVFTVSLDTPAPEGGLVIPISVSSTATEGTDYNLYADSFTYSKENALSFDGVDDYVKVPNSDQLELTDGTIEFWVKPDWVANSKNFNPAVLANRDTSGTRYSIHIRRGLNGVDLFNGSGVGTVSYNFEQGNWYHVALVETGTSTEVFINGEFQGSMSRGFSGVTGKDFHIGSSDGTREFFEGEIDEVRIWNKTRTQSEIQENLHTKLEGTEDGLVAYYKFDDTSYIDRSLSLNGVDDYVDTNAGIINLATADFTLEVWIKTDKVNQDIIVKSDDDTTYEAGEKRLFVLEDGTVAFAGFGNARISGGTAINDGEWHHIAVVWDYSSGSSGTGKLYLDGEDDTNPSAFAEYAARNLDRSTDTIKLGGSVSSNLFEGELNEVRFWNKTRTQSEIKDNLYTKLEGTEDGLVAYYNFDDDTAYIGQSLSFDGVNDYVQLTDGGVGGAFDGGSTAFTITGWIKPNSLSDDTTNHQIENVFLARATTGSNDNFELGITTDGKLNLYLDTNGGDTTIELGNGELTTGEWHSFALVFDSGSVTAYIDGTEYTGSVNGTQLDNAVGSPFTLGASINVDTFYNGEIDEVSIWNKVLTQSEIQDNLSTKLAGTEDGLVAYYNFDNDSGTTITDGTGSNNGTLNNGDGNNLVGSNIGYTTDWEVTETPVVKIAEGETEATITVSKIDDEIAESTAETVTVTLKNSDDYNLDTNNQTATVTLNDDDQAGIEFARLITSNDTVVATSLEYYNNTVVTSEVATIELEVTSDYANGEVGLKIASGDDSYTLTAGTQLSFSDGALVTVNDDTTISTDDAVILVPVTFVNAIATQDTISFTDEQSGTAIEIGVSTAYNPTTSVVGLQISSGVDALTFSKDTELTFSNGAVVTLKEGRTISSSTETLVPVSFANQILTNETSEIELPGEDKTTFGVRLSSQPTDDVTLTLTIGDSTEGQFANSASTQTLNFTTENWDTYQEVTLYGVDDNIDDDAGKDENSNTLYDYSIDVTTTGGNDSNYDLQISDAVFVKNQDNESTEDNNNKVSTNNTATNIASINVVNSELREDGTATAQFEINLSEAAPEGGIYVKYEIGDGTGTIGEDVFAYTLIGDDNPFNSYSTGSLSDLFALGSSPIFVDIDGDEDLDVFIGRSGGVFSRGGIDYYENTGDKSNPIFTERTGSDNPLNQVSLSSNVPSFVDIDNDGDLDAFVGYLSSALITDTISTDGSVVTNYTPTIYYYENTGNSTNPVFERRTGSDNPLEELIHNGNTNQPITTFGDMDNDGDFDLFVGGVNGKISYFENIGSAEGPIFQKLTGSNNPFNGIDVGDDSAPTLVDFDNDGDLDAFIGARNGTISYYLNSGTPEQAVFVERANPINFDVGSDSRPSIVDIDNDGYFEAFVGEKSGNINLYGFDSIREVYIPEGSTKSSKVTLIAVDDVIDEQRETFDIRVTENVDETLILEVTSNYKFNSESKNVREQPTFSYFLGLKINNAELTDSYLLTAGTVLNFTDIADNNTYSVTINENTVISNTSTEVRIQPNISLQGIDLLGATTSIINSDYIINEESSTGTFEIVDNDIAGLTIVDSDNNPLTSLTTSEDGSTETFYVSLNSKPIDNVAVYLGVENSGEGLLSDDNESNENLVKLVFSPDNWDTSQAVTLTSVDDDVDDSNITYNIISTVISEDIKYNEDNVILKLTEDFNYFDGSNNTISLLVDDLSVQETELAAGTQLTFANGMILEVESDTALSNSMATSVNVTQVQAANQILKNTTAFIDEDKSNLTEYLQIIVTEEYADGKLELQIDENSSIASVELSLGQELTFSNGTVFTVGVAATLSNTEASTIFGTIDSNLLKVATTEVSANATAEVTTDYTDKDSGRTEISVDTDYDEVAGTISLSINDNTASTVELLAGTQIDFSNGAAVTLDEDVTLTTTALSVNVSGVGNEITTSFTESISTDISVTNNDNDTAAVVVDRYDISSLEGYGNNFFNIKLATQPLGEVTVTMNPVDVNGDKDYNISLDDEFDGESYSVTFDETNWNLAKAVKVTAVDDYDIEYNHSSYIDFTVSSDEDSTYDGATATGDVIVKIEDNDLPTASIQAVAAASEAGSPGYFIVSLDQAAPDGFDGTGIVVNYSVSGTVDTDGSDDGETDDLKTLTGSVRIAPGETRSPIIAFPIDDFKVESIPLEVVSASGNNVQLQINTANLSDSQKQSLIELDGVTLDSGTELTFSNGAIANVLSTSGKLEIDSNGSVNSITANVEFTSDITTVATDETTSIPQETVVVTLSSGSDYSINENEPPSAILSIQDNDTPGVRIVEIGDTTVTENGTSEFYISLLSQPEADVTIALNGVPTERKLVVDQAYSNTASTIQLKVDDPEVDSLLLPAGTYTLGNAEVTVSSDTTIFSELTEVAVSSISSNIAANDSLTYSYTELGFDDTYTFNSDNWYKLQTVTVKGIDDSVAETGDFHSSTVEYTVTSTDPNYNEFEVAPQTINIIDRTFDKENTTESLIEGFFALQDGLDSVTLPIIGNLDGVAPSFIEDFIGNLVEEVKRTEYVTAESLKDAFNNVLKPRFGIVNVEITDLSTDNIEFKINIEDSFTKSIFLNGDLGLPALGIKIESDGSIDANFDYGMNLAFGISTDDGFYINTEDTGFEVGASLALSDEFTASGKLAFLQIEATNGDDIGTNIDAEFTISLEDADDSDDSNDEDKKKLTLTELNNLRKSDNLFDSIKYGFSGNAALDLDVVTSIKGSTGFPSFGLNISSNLPVFNYSNTDDKDEDENVRLTVVSSSATSLNIESGDSTNIVRLNKDTELKFGNTSVIVNKDTDIEPGKATTIDVTLADGSNGTIADIAENTIIETSKIPLLTIVNIIGINDEILDEIGSKEGSTLKLTVTSNNENTIQLKKDTELNFGDTKFLLKKRILSTGNTVATNNEIIDILPGGTNTIEVTVVGNGNNKSGETVTIAKDATADVSVGEILDSDPSLSLSEEVTSKEGDSTTLKVTSNNVTDTIQLNKGTQLKFEGTGQKVTVEETAYIGSGDTPSEIKVTVADDGDETQEESVTIAKDDKAKLVSSKFDISFNDITLDTGKFITDLMSPIINYVSDLIEPFEPIIDVLQTEIKFLDTVNLVDLFDENNDGSATLIEVASYLASTFSGTDLKYQKFFNAVTGIIELVETLEDLESDINNGENLSINFGNYSLKNFKGASDDEEDSASNTDTEESGGEALNSDTKEQAENSGSGSTGNKITNFFNKLDELGIKIPLIEDPFIAINLLLGQDIDLVTYDIPELDIGFQISQEFPIFGGISGLLEGAFSVSSDLLVGFDTYGLSRWEDKGFDLKDSYLILDGFYLSDVDPDTGKDVDELTMDATIAAGVSASAVVAKVELTGGITGVAGLDIIDGGEFTGESDGKLRGSEVLAANSFFDLFSLSGSLKAFIEAVVKVGVDVGLFEVMKTVWKEKFSVTLFEFELGGSSGTVSQSYIEGATVFFDSNLDGIWQEGEPVTTSNADGSYNLEIPLLFFDTNDNGKIDPEEGRIVTEGGTDTSSGVAVETPLIAPFGAKMVTPLTTIKQKLIEDGSTPEEAEQLIKEALEIPEDIKLEEFDALDAMSKGDERGSKVYKAHVQMQSLFAQTSEFMKGFDEEELEDKKRPIPEQAIDAIAKGFKKRKGKGKGRSPIDFNDSAELEELIKEPLEGKIKPKSGEKREKLPKSFSVLAQTMASGNKEIDEVFKGVRPKDILGKVAPVKKVTQDKLPKELRKLIGGAKREDIKGLLERVPDAEEFLGENQSLSGDTGQMKDKSADKTPMKDESGDKPAMKDEKSGQSPKENQNPLPIIDSLENTTIVSRKAKKLAKGKGRRNLLELDGDDLTDTKIKFSLSSKNLPSGRIHEIAIFTTENQEGTINGLSPEDAGYKEAALAKARSIFSILPDDFIANPKRIMKGFADKNIGFLLVKNGTLDSVRRGRTSLDSVLFGTEQQGEGFRGIQMSETGESSFQLSFEDEMGAADFTDIVINAQLTDETPEIGTDTQGGNEAEILDLRNYAGKQITIEAPIVREESAYENVVGFYVVEDENGAVRDPLTGNLLNPGDEGYTKAALRNSQNNAFQMGETGLSGSLEMAGGLMFAPFVIANGTLEEVLNDNSNDAQVFFAHIGANSDGFDHFRNLGGNTWGVEDMPDGGDMDYNDIVFKLDVTVS